MKNVTAVFLKEMKAYFVSPVAYVVLTVFLVIAGYFFTGILNIFFERSMMAMMQAQQYGGMPPSIDVPALVSRNFFGVVSTIVLFMLPMITMATYADEKRRGTIELLLTSPITNLEIVLGKFLAALSFFVVMLLPTFLYMGFLFLYSEPRMPVGPIFSGYLGLLLLGGTLISLGIFISTLTENQIVAASITFGVFLLLWVIDLAARSGGSTLQEILSHLSILNHFEDFAKGVIDTSSLILYGSLIFLGLFLTFRSIESLRWRQ
jgi:ABC-2 type transport system permease protein